MSLPTEFDVLIKRAVELQTQYKDTLSKKHTCISTIVHILGQTNSADIIESLSKLASCYATAVKVKPKDTVGHIGLGLVMEEMFYVEDFYGHKPLVVSEI